ncbi:hypothetical protein [Algoriphagus aquimarinus]|uniref:DUF4293 family protein n=1 Tax=Algoriphagus aquimarinus TaxID=237018 RepID=A0A1I1C1P0_9BACT|nr:hypothetical protein [Algoriphagus aquimarinus]SFB54473.1 hypothetical protein SAMN04489723_11878 [Algoriphagus aquimarinus]
MKTEDTKIPLITLVILMVTSFVPVIQLTMLMGQGAFLYPFNKLLVTPEFKSLNYINLFSGTLTVIAFYISRRRGYKIIWTVLTVFFFMGFLTFVTESTRYEDYPYFIPIMVIGVLVTLPLIIVGIIKEKMVNPT